MEVSYNVEEKALKRAEKKMKDSEEITSIRKFLNSENQNMVFTYDDADTARKKRNNLLFGCKRRNLKVKTLLRGNSIIILKKND